MMSKKSMVQSIWLFAFSALALFGCSTTPSGGGAYLDPSMVKVVKDFPDHAFDANEYIAGMQKAGKNLLVWKDTSADLSKYKSITVSDFGSRLLPVQNAFSYATFVATFNSNFKGGLSIAQKNSANSLKIVGEIVECNPGSRAARYWVGMGAGKATGAIACEIYEPGKSKPSMRIYSRDTASAGGFGGDSVAMLNHIINQLAFRTANTINTTVGR